MKKILIVSPYFAPENSVASIRFTKIAKYLIKMGYDVEIIYTQMDANLVVDKTLEKELPIFKKRVRINYPKRLYYGIKKRMGTENAKNRPVLKDQNKVKNGKLNEMVIWTYVHLCNLMLGRRYIRYIKSKKKKYDVVISTFIPVSSHMLGHYMKKKGLCTTWIADFRDSISMLCESKLAVSIIQKYTMRKIKNADYVTTVSQGCAEMLIDEAKAYGQDLSGKMHVISNGYDAADREKISGFQPQKDKLIFSYCGTIYRSGGKIKNDVSALFEVISNLIHTGIIDRKRIEVRYAGRDADLFGSFAEKYGVPELVKYYGRISRDESLKLQRESDVALVPVWNNKNEKGILSGKFFETLLTQRNVLCIVTGDAPGSELASLVRELHCGFAYEEVNGDKTGIPELEKWISDIYQEKIADGEVKYHNCCAEEPYSHQFLAKKFERLF